MQTARRAARLPRRGGPARNRSASAARLVHRRSDAPWPAVTWRAPPRGWDARMPWVAGSCHGEKRRAPAGFPTINVPLPSPRKLLPPQGVYAVRVQTPRGAFGGMLNLGPRPTFGDGTGDARGPPLRCRGRLVWHARPDRLRRTAAGTR